jgi:hypothetical protein
MGTNGFTVTAWVKSDDYDTGFGGGQNPNGFIFSTRNDGASATGYGLNLNNVNGNHQVSLSSRQFVNGISSPVQAWTTGIWAHVTATYDGGSTQKIYVDGIEVAVGANDWSGLAATARARIGREGNTGYYYDGVLDEVRVSSLGRSSNWVWAVYWNSASNASFVTYGAGEGPSEPDADGDGIPDDWEFRYTGSPTGLVATADAEPPGQEDGIPNLAEYLLDYHPLESNLPFRLQEIELGGGLNLTFGVTTNSRVYTVDTSTNLTDGTPWRPAAGPRPGSNGVLTVIDLGGSDTKDYRIRVHVP